VILEDSPRHAPGARPGYSPVALTGIAGHVLVKEVNWLGDLVISLPALRAIRAAFATSTLTVMVKRELAGFFDGMNWVDEVMPYTVGRGLRGCGIGAKSSVKFASVASISRSFFPTASSRRYG
jgi:hypothetical protein